VKSAAEGKLQLVLRLTEQFI